MRNAFQFQILPPSKIRSLGYRLLFILRSPHVSCFTFHVSRNTCLNTQFPHSLPKRSITPPSAGHCTRLLRVSPHLHSEYFERKEGRIHGARNLLNENC